MTLKETIEKYLVDRDVEERTKHEPSGKLSASSLGYPTQWQVLKALGVPQKPFEVYTLGVFERGRQVEDWLVGIMKPDQTQVPVTYRGVVGFVDAVKEIPREIKSVKNSKFKRITQQKKAYHGHILQGALYALALGAEKFAIDYVAADDFRTHTYIYKTETYKQEIDQIIDDFNKSIESKTIPKFVAKEVWKSSPAYNNFYDWIELSEEDSMTKLRKEFTEQFNKYQSGTLKCQEGKK